MLLLLLHLNKDKMLHLMYVVMNLIEELLSRIGGMRKL